MNPSRGLRILAVASLLVFLGSCVNYIVKVADMGYKASLYDGAERGQINDAIMISLALFGLTALLWFVYLKSKSQK